MRTARTRSFDTSLDGGTQLIETVERLAWGIAVDGLPEGIHVVDTLHAHLAHDGVADHVESTDVLASWSRVGDRRNVCGPAVAQ